MDYLGFAYAATVAAGGILGYAKAASVPSLAAGLLFGSLAGFGAYQTSNNPKEVRLMLVTSAVLVGVMGPRYYRTGKFMPAGLIAGISLMMLCRSGYRMIQN